MKSFEQPNVTSYNFIRSALTQGYPIVPDCQGTGSCGEDLGVYCADLGNGIFSPGGSDYIILFELSNTTCDQNRNPLDDGCEFIANNGAEDFPLTCAPSSLSPTVLGATCSGQGCAGEAAVYEFECDVSLSFPAPACGFSTTSVRLECPDVPVSSCDARSTEPI